MGRGARLRHPGAGRVPWVDLPRHGPARAIPGREPGRRDRPGPQRRARLDLGRGRGHDPGRAWLRNGRERRQRLRLPGPALLGLRIRRRRILEPQGARADLLQSGVGALGAAALSEADPVGPGGRVQSRGDRPHQSRHRRQADRRAGGRRDGLHDVQEPVSERRRAPLASPSDALPSPHGGGRVGRQRSGRRGDGRWRRSRAAHRVLRPAAQLVRRNIRLDGHVTRPRSRLMADRRTSFGGERPGYPPIVANRLPRISSACVMMLRTSSLQVGMSWIRAWLWPVVQMPPSRSPPSRTLARPRTPAISSLTSAKVLVGSRWISATCSEIVLRATRAVLRRVRPTRTVSRSVFSTIRFLTFSWIFASTVARKRVLMLMASAPRASAATRLRPSAMPPEAITGTSTASTVAGSSTISPMSSSPGWPAHSKPSMLTTSKPLRTAETEWRTEVHLWMTLTPCSLKRGRWSVGARPAVSAILIPEWMIASR